MGGDFLAKPLDPEGPPPAVTTLGTLVERVAAIVPGVSEPWPGFGGKGDSGVPNK